MRAIFMKAIRLTPLLEGPAYSAVALLARLYLANIFFTSGWLKLQNFLNGNWDATVYLFTDIHPVPFLPPEIAAVLGTAGEVGLSALLALGLFTRCAAAGLIAMCAAMHFALPDDLQLLWAFILAFVVCKGGGVWSLESGVWKKS